jgi:hypothetical protein
MIVAAEAGGHLPLAMLPMAEMVMAAKSIPVPEIAPGPVVAVPIVMGVV